MFHVAAADEHGVLYTRDVLLGPTRFSCYGGVKGWTGGQSLPPPRHMLPGPGQPIGPGAGW